MSDESTSCTENLKFEEDPKTTENLKSHSMHMDAVPVGEISQSASLKEQKYIHENRLKIQFWAVISGSEQIDEFAVL